MKGRFVVIDAEQRSIDWFTARLGRLTGTAAADMLDTIKVGEAAKRRDLRVRLALERLTERGQESSFVNAEMQRGIDLEPMALAAYEDVSSNIARTTGFLQMTGVMAGCSLDGHVRDFEGIVEVKCPKSATHLRYLRGKQEPPVDYVPQITHNLWVSGAQWCDFLSFDDRFPPGRLQTWLVRVHRKDVDIDGYERKALAFLAEVDAEYEAIRSMADPAAVPAESVR